MYYRKYQPCAALLPFVECYFIWDSEGALENTIMIESPPNGFCSIVFNYGDAYYLQNKKYNRLPVPLQFLSGLSIYTYQLFLQGTIGIAGIVFKPAALGTLFQLPMYDFVEERTDLYQLFKTSLINEYAAGIKAGNTDVARVKLLEEFVLLQLSMHTPEPDYIDEAANLIVEHNGMLQVTDLLKNSCMSRRTFERKFFHKVGLSPKYYARVRRIGYLCSLIVGKKKVDWAKVLYECNFYDQAHFIKDFEEFIGRPPQQYLHENAELIHYVGKPTTYKIS